jgi:SOS-response transcriptional repressor LexA
MRRKEQKLDLFQIPISGQIGAGKVVPFMPRDDSVTVAVPSGLAKPDQIGSMVVSGNSLADEQIFDGDILIFRTNVTNKDLKRDSICVVYITATGELLAKKVRYSESRVALIPAAEGFDTLYYEPEAIEVRGIVFQFVRRAMPHGGFRKADHDEIPF